jgi:Phosphatidylinositol-4-phosphate 5-Kinase
MKVNLSKNLRNLIVSQLKLDAEFFKHGNINDYSILLGIVDLKPGEAEKIIRESPNLE